MPLLNNQPKSEEELKLLAKWNKVRRYVFTHFGKKPDLNALLFLIGMNEVGKQQANYSKEEKQDLMHVAICKLFEADGYFSFEKKDNEGWPHYQVLKHLPKSALNEQENLIKQKIIHYFESLKIIEF